MNRSRLLERFLRYARIDSTADDAATCYPSTPGQFDVSRLLVEQLHAMGASDVELDKHGLVMAMIPGVEDKPVVALNSHVDTSPETTGANVKPQLIESYAGGDIALSGAPLTITTKDNPELNQLIGKTLITTDGTTLLGADDKAGLAIIMELASHLLEHPELTHAPVRILFTCDEEIGRGVDYVDLEKLGADVAYTLDGPGANQIDVETFSADMALVTVRGVNIHPSIGKDRMVNAIRAAGAFLDAMPKDRSPERTADRDGFLHPYRMEGGVAEVTMHIALRDFDESGLRVDEQLLRDLAAQVEQQFPGSEIVVEIRKQYRNLGLGLAKEPRAVTHAVAAHQALGREPVQTIIRGGTDGSMLTERGLPTPNLSSGQHNPHSPLEWACLDEMEAAVEVLIELVQIWGRD